MKTAQAFTAEDRQAYIGASEVATVMGLNPYQTAISVYNAKLGIGDAFDGNNHTERGNKLEAVAANEYSEQTGIKLRRQNQEFRHPQYTFIVGHIDRVAVGEKRLIEIKCPSVAAFRKFQREGIPASFIIQMQMYLGLTGYPKGTWVIFCADQWDMAVFDIEFDADIYAKAVDAAVQFWTDHVQTQTPPNFDATPSEVELPTINDGSITTRTDEAFTTWATRYREAMSIKADADELLDGLKADGLKLIDSTTGIYTDGNGFTVNYYETAGRKTLNKELLQATYPDIDLEPCYKIGKPSRTFKVTAR